MTRASAPPTPVAIERRIARAATDPDLTYRAFETLAVIASFWDNGPIALRDVQDFAPDLQVQEGVDELVHHGYVHHDRHAGTVAVFAPQDTGELAAVVPLAPRTDTAPIAVVPQQRREAG